MARVVAPDVSILSRGSEDSARATSAVHVPVPVQLSYRFLLYLFFELVCAPRFVFADDCYTLYSL